ncbi:hypothetical protein M0805_003170 [Coniferiporia weirii]|nr:hypothetical protein M0805_003170 [Coniferiporia weirii]
MSLPKAQRLISENPPKNSVAAPTVKAEQELDVDRKLRLYGVIQAFRNGRMPGNTQIDEALSYVRDNSLIERKKLSPEGRKLTEDVRDIVETVRCFVNEKNADELVQSFLSRSSVSQYKSGPGVDAPISEKEARQDAKEALEHMHTLFQILITNDETRKLLSDVKLISLDIFADAASTVADRVRPEQDELDRVDEAMPANNFDDFDDGFSVSPVGREANLSGTKLPVSTRERTDDSITPDVGVGAEKDKSAASMKKTLRSRFRDLAGRIPDKHKQLVNAELDSGQKYLRTRFPKERRGQFIYRLKKIIVECQEHPSYQASLSWFLSQLEAYFSHGEHLASAGSKQKASFFADPMLDQAISEVRTFLERCANGKGMEDMFSGSRRMWEDAQDDEELRTWWSRVDTLIRKSLLEPGFVLTSTFESQARQLQNESRKFFSVRYKEHRDALVDSIQRWVRAWSEDSLNRRLGGEINQLIKDLLFDTQGRLTYKPPLWLDICEVIIPTLFEKVGYLPIPRVEYADKDFDVVLENLTLQGRNLFPKFFEANTQNYVKLSPYKEIRDKHDHKITVTLSQIQSDMRDVAFSYRKKTGLRISDAGLADVFIGGKGVSILIELSSNTSDRAASANLYKVEKVSVKIDSLKIAIRDSKHGLIYRILSIPLANLLKKRMSGAISDAVRRGLEYANGRLVEIRDRVSAAEGSEDSSKIQAIMDIWNNQKHEVSSTASMHRKSKRQGHFRLVTTSESMMLPERGYEKGWIRKQAERDAAAATDGEGWRSKAFSIVPSSG